ncbi:unnamed protein product, partial [Amoebophrya sp. A25]|eukprot:GSA25T00022400001.1
MYTVGRGFPQGKGPGLLGRWDWLSLDFAADGVADGNYGDRKDNYDKATDDAALCAADAQNGQFGTPVELLGCPTWPDVPYPYLSFLDGLPVFIWLY